MVLLEKKKKATPKAEEKNCSFRITLPHCNNTTSITTRPDSLLMSLFPFFFEKLYISTTHPRRWQLSVVCLSSNETWKSSRAEVHTAAQQLMMQLVLLHSSYGKDHNSWRLKCKLTFSSCWVYAHSFPFLIDAYTIEMDGVWMDAGKSAPSLIQALFVEGSEMTESCWKFY